MKYLFAATAWCLPALVEAKDITQLVRSNTDIDDQIAALCAGKCGNQGSSQLDSIVVTKKSEKSYDVISKASAKFHQHNVIPAMFGDFAGRDFDIEYQINVTAYAALEPATCRLTINKIDIEGDNFGIADKVSNFEGKIYRLKDCKRYI